MPSWPSSVRSRASTFLDEVVLYRSTPEALEKRIGERAREQTIRSTRVLMLVAATVGLLWWPFDLWLYWNQPEVIRVFAVWRSEVIACSMGYYLTADRWAWTRRHNTPWATAFGGAMAFFIAAALGSLGATDRPWFGSLYYVPIMSFPFLVRPVVRVAGTSAVGLLALLGFFAVHPENLARGDLGTAVGLMLFGITVSVCAGHAMYHGFRLNVVQAEHLDGRTRELEEMSGSLAVRVDERTRELRLLAAHIDRLHEDQGTELAHELHDELGQLLTGMRMELDLADRVLERGGDVAQQHRKLGALLDTTLESTRGILSHLRPRILDDFGLVAALEWLVSDVARRAQLDAQFVAEPEDFAVPDDVGVGVFRIVQESLTNVLRHAGARKVRVRLVLDGDGLTATVEDDGQGLPPLDEHRPGAIGLVGMRERATALGGSFELSVSAEGGTRVRVRLPPASVATAAFAQGAS